MCNQDFQSNITFVEDKESPLVKKDDIELERLLLEEELIEKRSRLNVLREEIEEDEKILQALTIVVPWLRRNETVV